MRGEHLDFVIHGLGLLGSSPHARGTRAMSLKESLDGGIIPACAGNT